MNGNQYSSCVISQVINGVPAIMEYPVSFAQPFDPTKQSSGSVNANPNGATVVGVYDYTPAINGGVSSFSLSLMCTQGLQTGPQSNTCTVFNGTQISGDFLIFAGNLRGIPPYISNETFQFNFAEGSFILYFLDNNGNIVNLSS